MSNLVNNWWKISESENIIHIWPRPSSLHNGPQWEEFCKMKRYLEEINNDPVDLLGSSVENDEVNLIEKENEDEQIEDNKQEELYHERILLAEIDPNANIVNSSELGSRMMDINYDWY
ncbi:16102_t:CDS:2, partial [Racocetra persica]